MAYLDFIDELPRGIKILFAILLNPLFVIYRFIKDIHARSWILLLLDCLFCLEFFFVFLIFKNSYLHVRDKKPILQGL